MSDMGFMQGFVMRMLFAFALFCVVAWWMRSRSKSVAEAKFINGIAQALARLGRAAVPVSDKQEKRGDDRWQTIKLPLVHWTAR